MVSPSYRPFQVRAKTNQVVDYHYDDSKPGKPLYLLIPGGIIALASLALIIFIAFRTWFEGGISQTTGLGLMLLLAPLYVGGVFLFSYGYELYDVPKALRLTAIIVFISLASVVILAVLFALLSGKDSKSSSSSSSSSRSSSSGGRGSGFFDGLGSIYINTGSSTRTVTHEVIREVPVADPATSARVEPSQPQPIKCPYCGRSYIPAETKYACPSCGAATPQEFIAKDPDQ